MPKVAFTRLPDSLMSLAPIYVNMLLDGLTIPRTTQITSTAPNAWIHLQSLSLDTLMPHAGERLDCCCRLYHDNRWSTALIILTVCQIPLSKTYLLTISTHIAVSQGVSFRTMTDLDAGANQSTQSSYQEQTRPTPSSPAT